MKNILIIGEFPAPYRVDLCKAIAQKWKTKVYFESQQDDKRDNEWLKKDNIESEILDSWKSRKNFYKDILNIKKYDLVFIFNNSLRFSILLEIACKINKVPFLLNCDGCNDIKEDDPVKKYAKRYLMKGAKAYFAGGRSARRYFVCHGVDPRKIYIDNFTALYKGDIEKTLISKEAKRSLKTGLEMKERFVVITVGRHIKCKGFDIILKAAEHFGRSVGFYIIGGEPSKENSSYRERHHIENVHFVGFKDKKELKKYYLAADLFVLMTRGDTWGLVVNEAMANGLPVITTDRCVAGVELITEEENGYIIEVDDQDTLVEKIRTMINDPSLMRSMSQNNITKIKSHTMENMIETHIKVINRFI